MAEQAFPNIAKLVGQLNEQAGSYEQVVVAVRDVLLAIFHELENVRKNQLDAHTQASLARYESDIVRTRYHLQNLDFSVMMIGPMKSGKSTTLESIVGWEIIPKRETPATTIPTKFVHRPHILLPELSFPMAQKFNEMAAICKIYYEDLKNRSRNGDASATEEINLNKNTQPNLFPKIEAGRQFEDKYYGEAEVRDALEYANDIVRFYMNCEAQRSMTDSVLRALENLDNFPKVEVCFRSEEFRSANPNIGTLTIIDTPGPNEDVPSEFLQDLKNQLVKQVNGVVYVCDSRTVQSSAEADIRRSIQHFKNMLFIVANRFDSWLEACEEDEDEAARKLAQVVISQFTGRNRPSPSQVYPICARDFSLCAFMQRVYEEGRGADPTVQKDPRFTSYKRRFNPKAADFPNKPKMLTHVKKSRGTTRVPHFLQAISDNLLRTVAEHSISEAVAMLEFMISKIKDELIIMLQEPRRIQEYIEQVRKIQDNVAKEVAAIRAESDLLVQHMQFWVDNHFMIGYSTDIEIIKSPTTPPSAEAVSIGNLFGNDFKNATAVGKSLSKGECGAAVDSAIRQLKSRFQEDMDASREHRNTMVESLRQCTEEAEARILHQLDELMAELYGSSGNVGTATSKISLIQSQLSELTIKCDPSASFTLYTPLLKGLIYKRADSSELRNFMMTQLENFLSVFKQRFSYDLAFATKTLTDHFETRTSSQISALLESLELRAKQSQNVVQAIYLLSLMQQLSDWIRALKDNEAVKSEQIITPSNPRILSAL